MPTPERINKYQRTVVQKKCSECEVLFSQMRRLSGIWPPCIKKRRANFRPKTYKMCDFCKNKFGPVDHLKRKFCSYKCKAAKQSTGIKSHHRSNRIARNAQRLIKYYIDKGAIIRPNNCEECGNHGKKIEAAHFDYSDPLRVRWLCRSCHVLWDKKNPKNGTIKINVPRVSVNNTTT